MYLVVRALVLLQLGIYLDYVWYYCFRASQSQLPCVLLWICEELCRLFHLHFAPKFQGLLYLTYALRLPGFARRLGIEIQSDNTPQKRSGVCEIGKSEEYLLLV